MFPLQVLIRHAACIEQEIERVVACALVETRLFVHKQEFRHLRALA
jgi:hypothetical protein